MPNTLPNNIVSSSLRSGAVSDGATIRSVQDSMVVRQPDPTEAANAVIRIKREMAGYSAELSQPLDYSEHTYDAKTVRIAAQTHGENHGFLQALASLAGINKIPVADAAHPQEGGFTPTNTQTKPIVPAIFRANVI